MTDDRYMWNHDGVRARRPNVLVVAADEDTRSRILAAVSPVAGSVELSHGSRYALGRVDEGGFDAVVVDLSVPQGWALLRCVASAASACPVIALSPTLDDDDIADATAMGASAVLPRMLPVTAMLRVALVRALRRTADRHLAAV